MIIFGVVSDPINLCNWMKENNIKYSLNTAKYFVKVAIFDSITNMLLSKYRLGGKIIIIFDVCEKLVFIEGIKIIQTENLNELKDALLSNKPVTASVKMVSYKQRNYISETIEFNKNSGIMHTYATNLYSITNKVLREQIRKLVLQCAAGNLDHNKITTMLFELKSVKRGKVATASENLLNLVQSDEFIRIRETLKEVLKLKDPDGNKIEILAKNNKVEPYDVRYLYHALTKK